MKVRNLKFLARREGVDYYSATLYSGGLLVEINITVAEDGIDVCFPVEVETAAATDDVHLIDIIKKELGTGGERYDNIF